jgi:hypothetical protein
MFVGTEEKVAQFMSDGVAEAESQTAFGGLCGGHGIAEYGCVSASLTSDG